MKQAKYSDYKNSGIDWIGEIPSHWEVRRVKSIFRLVAEPAHKNNDFELLSLYTDIGVKPRKDLAEKGNKASTTDGYWHVKKGDIVVNKLLAWMGAIGVSDYNGVTSPAYDILRAYKPIESNYYHRLFRTKRCVSELRRHSRGIMDMRLRLYFDKLGNIKIPYPPLSEQQAIADYLDRKCGQIDQAVAQKQQLFALLKERKQIMIQQAVTKGLNPNAPMKDSDIDWIGEIPEGWEVKRLRYILKERNERTENGEEPLFMMSQIHGLVVRADYHEKAQVARDNFGNKIVHFDDLVFNKLKAHLGVFFKSTIPYKGLVSPDYAVYYSNGILTDLKFLEYIFRLPAYISQFICKATGIVEGLIRLYTGDLFEIAIPVPPKEEQSKILAHIEAESAKIDKALALQEKQIAKLKEYKQVLINSAVTGKVKVEGMNNPLN
jgi:type I restriction enzyme S subunit